jgi:hypothetical protein
MNWYCHNSKKDHVKIDNNSYDIDENLRHYEVKHILHALCNLITNQIEIIFL